MSEKKEEGYTTYELFKIFDKLEQRIAKLEKVLESHAKCIGEMREDKEDKELREDYKAGKFEL
jgi:hypothetical protein